MCVCVWGGGGGGGGLPRKLDKSLTEQHAVNKRRLDTHHHIRCKIPKECNYFSRKVKKVQGERLQIVRNNSHSYPKQSGGSTSLRKLAVWFITHLPKVSCVV